MIIRALIIFASSAACWPLQRAVPPGDRTHENNYGAILRIPVILGRSGADGSLFRLERCIGARGRALGDGDRRFRSVHVVRDPGQVAPIIVAWGPTSGGEGHSRTIKFWKAFSASLNLIGKCRRAVK